MVGIDEVGRGSLAGPLLVVAARQICVLPEGLTDSKLMTRAAREALFESLINACEFGEGWVEPAEIDRLGLGRALRLGVKRSLLSLKARSDEPIVMDGSVNYCPRRYLRAKCLIGADARVPIVSSASVYAKVKRDRFMTELAKSYPDYGFESHVGYGTKKHLAALAKFGPLDAVHRQVFAPIKRLKGLESWLQPT